MDPLDYIMHPEIEDYAEVHTTDEDDLLHQLSRETHLKVIYPRMLSGKVQGQFLRMVSRMIRPACILEIGTYTGYSAICLASGLREGGRLFTIEINKELEDMIRRYIEKAGLSEQVHLLIGDALELIPQLPHLFDLVYIDAAKEHYVAYYEAIFDRVVHGGYILADNALWDGKALNPDDAESKGIAAFNDFVQNDHRVENVLITLRDGLMLIRKK